MYTFITALKSIYRNKFINITVIISLALGMLFPMLVFCIGNVQLAAIWAGVVKNADRSAGLFTDQTTRIDTEKAMRDYPQIELMTETSFVSKDYIAASDSNFIKTETAGGKAGIDQFNNYNMLYGRFLTDEELNGSERVCVISMILWQQLKCKVGDTITVGKEDFTVKGVYISRDTRIVMPLDTFSEKYPVMYSYNILFKKDCDVKTEGTEILDKLLAEYNIENPKDDPDHTKYILSSEYYISHYDLRNAYIALGIMLAIAAVVLIYAALNISNIMVNKINTDMKNYTIKMQLGASKKSIFGFLLVQLLVLMLISVVIDVITVYFLKSFTSFLSVFSYDISPLTVLLTALIGTVYVLILSSSLVKRVYKERRTAR